MPRLHPLAALALLLAGCTVMQIAVRDDAPKKPTLWDAFAQDRLRKERFEPLLTSQESEKCGGGSGECSAVIHGNLHGDKHIDFDAMKATEQRASEILAQAQDAVTQFAQTTSAEPCGPVQ